MTRRIISLISVSMEVSNNMKIFNFSEIITVLFWEGATYCKAALEICNYSYYSLGEAVLLH